MRLVQTLPGALLLGSIFGLSGCISNPSEERANMGGKTVVQDVSLAEKTKRTEVSSRAPQTAASEEAGAEHGIRIIFQRDTEVRSGGKVSYTRDGQTYSEDLPPLASARMCAIRLLVLCSRNGLKTELDPPHAVKIFETDVEVRTTNVAFGLERF